VTLVETRSPPVARQERTTVAALRRAARRHAFLAAADALFRERGYGATALNDIVKRSGGSLATLYELFGSKQGLFQAMIEDRCRSGIAALDAPDVDDLPLREALRRIGVGFMRLAHSPEAISILRMIVAEGAQFPELPRLFYENGPARSHVRVGAWLAEQDRRGSLRVPDPIRAARDFCALMCADSHMRAMIGLAPPLSEEELAAKVDHAVDALIAIHAP
jgi:AcrR family transcriptional regulator